MPAPIGGARIRATHRVFPLSPTVPDPLAVTAPLPTAPPPPEERFHELKFVLEPDRAARVERFAAETFGTAGKTSSATTLLFLDTAGLHMARRLGELRRERFRARREGESGTVLLERKTKRGDRARLRSSPIDLGDLPRLGTTAVGPDGPGRRFHRHVVEHGLRPVCCVTFSRMVFVGAGPDGPVRVAFDQDLRGEVGGAWSLRPIATGTDLLGGRVLVEVRFPEILPSPFRALVAEMRLEPASFSKCRRALASAGILTGAPE